MRRAALVIMMSLATVVAGSTSAGAATIKHWSVSQVTKAFTGTGFSYQLDTNTLARTTISGWHKTAQTKVGYRWWPQVTVTRRCIPGHICAMAATKVVYQGGPNGYHLVGKAPASAHYTAHHSWPWYQFWHWNWGKIVSWTWNKIFKKCIYGTVGGTGAIGSTNVAAKVLIRAGAIAQNAGDFAGPAGFAIAALGGCFFGMTFGNLPGVS